MMVNTEKIAEEMKKVKTGKDIEEEVMEEKSREQRKIVGRMTDGSSIVEINDTKKNEVIHTEAVDSVAKCPRCGSNKVNWVFTKRGVSIKCQSCGFDTHFLQDVLSHKKRELEVIPILKQMFPQLTFIENVPIDTNLITGEVGKATVRYDFKVFLFDKKLARCKVSVVQNTKLDHYLKTEEQYLFGRPEMVDYLAKIDGIMIWFFPDDGKKIAMAECREIRKFATKVTDRFGNSQYHLPKEVRKVLIKTSFGGFKMLLFKNLYDYITKNVYIV